jgi:dCTP deaminase
MRERAVYAHCIHFDDDDRRLMRDTQTATAVSPTSNLFLGSGFFDFEGADRIGYRYGLASDVGGGTSFSPFATMMAAYYVGREGQTKPGISIAPSELWWRHTGGAAEALGLDGVIGNLQPGCEADFVVLDPKATPLLARKTKLAANLEETAVRDDRAGRRPAGRAHGDLAGAASLTNPSAAPCLELAAPRKDPDMSIKSDKWIRRMAEQTGMIEPFEPGQVREREGHKIISYGTSSYGYDIRCAPEFKVFTNIHSTVVDPKNFDEKSFVDMHGDYCIIPPNSFALARTVEYFRIPRNVLTICLGKSTYARCGIIVNVTPFEPEWEGYVTLEFSNTTPLPAKIYAGEGCAQVLFFESDEVCETSYKDRGGKYQGQRGVTLPKT